MLIYAGRFSWADTELMPVKELDWHYERLVKQKKDEAAAIERAKRGN